VGGSLGGWGCGEGGGEGVGGGGGGGGMGDVFEREVYGGGGGLVGWKLSLYEKKKASRSEKKCEQPSQTGRSSPIAKPVSSQKPGFPWKKHWRKVPLSFVKNFL